MCDERERLIGYVYDECDPRERGAIEQHLETCAECREEIRGLRSVRQDLLAWDVPAHDSVWKPFAPARVEPWWRGVPVWAMAAAATVMFLTGAAGGVATHALMEHRPAVTPPASAAVVLPVQQVVPIGVSRADLDAFGRQLVSTMRSEMDARVRLVSAHAPSLAAMSDRDFQQIRATLASNDQRYEEIRDVVRRLNNDMVTIKSGHDKQISSLRRSVDQLSTALAAMQPGGKQ